MSIHGNHVQNATHSGECMCKWGIKRSFYERTFFHWQRHQSVREPMMSIVPEEESMHSHNLSPDEDTKPDNSKAFPSSKSRTFQTLSAVQAFGAIMASDLKVNQKSSGSQTQLTGLMSVSSTSHTLPPSYQFQGSSSVVQQVSILPTCLLAPLVLTNSLLLIFYISKIYAQSCAQLFYWRIFAPIFVLYALHQLFPTFFYSRAP